MSRTATKCKYSQESRCYVYISMDAGQYKMGCVCQMLEMDEATVRRRFFH
ncbi:MAG: hypothetical protein NC089_11890 [Bacteroides sp.]|nr:hypothetical protein [Bacteroides sp.]MCM1550573.1 hypothetical protein [Clostridium sp.]